MIGLSRSRRCRGAGIATSRSRRFRLSSPGKCRPGPSTDRSPALHFPVKTPRRLVQRNRRARLVAPRLARARVRQAGHRRPERERKPAGGGPMATRVAERRRKSGPTVGFLAATSLCAAAASVRREQRVGSRLERARRLMMSGLSRSRRCRGAGIATSRSRRFRLSSPGKCRPGPSTDRSPALHFPVKTPRRLVQRNRRERLVAPRLARARVRQAGHRRPERERKPAGGGPMATRVAERRRKSGPTVGFLAATSL